MTAFRHWEEHSATRFLDCFAALGTALLLFFATPASAQTFPKLTGRVVDQAHLLSAAQAVDISSKSEALQAQTGRQFVVATVNSLEGYPIEDYGYRLGRNWHLGQKGKDDGVILLVAPNERKVRIEIGYGAAPFMTDAVSGTITRSAILPHFKQKPPDYGGGIVAGADAIIKQMSLPTDEAQANLAKAQQAERARRDQSPGIVPVIFWIILILFMIAVFARASGGRRYRRRRGWRGPIVLWGPGWGGGSSWSGGSSWGGGRSWGGGGWGGGGGFSGGGGSFGGSGVSGSW